MAIEAFSDAELSALDDLWRELADNHPWSGWARILSEPQEIWVFRTRANWRRFTVRKASKGFLLHDEGLVYEAMFRNLNDLPDVIAAVPALQPEADSPGV